MNTTTAETTTRATDREMLRHYGMAERDSIGVDVLLTNVEARILAELVGAEESEAWSVDPMVASRLRGICLKLLKAAASGDAEVAA
jgi:hypothetical protein